MNTAAEQLKISVSPRMAQFIRENVKSGGYTDASEVVADAVRRMRETEAAKKGEVFLTSFEASRSEDERASIRRGMSRGMQDIEEGLYQSYDADGLRSLAEEMVAASARKRAGRAKPK